MVLGGVGERRWLTSSMLDSGAAGGGRPLQARQEGGGDGAPARPASHRGARLSGGWAGLRGEGARVGRFSTGGEGGESLLLLLRKRGARVGRDRRLGWAAR